MYLSIDVGSASTKVALYDPNGRLCASHSVAYDIHYPHSNWAEQDPGTWWDATRQCCKRIAAEWAGRSIAAIAVSGQAPGCVAIDREGNPLRPAILWMDRRAVPQVERLRSQFGLERAIRIGGNTLDSYFGGVKWMWFKEEEPELYKATWKLLQANNYITYRLVNEVVTDPSQAGLCSPCFNLQEGDWDVSACEAVGIDPDRLPRIVGSADIVGLVSPEAAQETGLPERTPVICGGGDFAFACLGAGVVERGGAAIMLGTSGNLLIPGCPGTDPRLLNTIHVTGERLTLGAVLAGAAVSWCGQMLQTGTPDVFALLDAEASHTPPGAEGLIFLPYLMGARTPFWDPLARGAFIGLSPAHTRGHLFRAVLEGVAYAFRQMIDIVSAAGMPITAAVVVDGGARGPVWRQILADILEVPIRWRPTSGGTSLGSAYLAALACQGGQSRDDLSGWFEPTVDTHPRPELQERYQVQYQVFCELYDQLHHSFSRLHSNTAE